MHIYVVKPVVLEHMELIRVIASSTCRPLPPPSMHLT